MSFYTGGSSGARRSNSNTTQYQPFMFGNSRGFCVGDSSCPQTLTPNTICAPQQYMPAVRTSSLNSYNNAQSVHECMHWPTSMNSRQQQSAQRNNQMTNFYMDQGSSRQASNSGYSGDSGQYCSSPPKVFLSAPGMDTRQINQGIQCQVAPLGTDPMSLIKPMAALNVNVRAPADLFDGSNGEPRTIAISPAQLYGGVSPRK